jgi:VWFA-related protein
MLGLQQQEPPQEPEPDPGGFRIGVAVDQVFLSVTARSLEGGFVKGLTKEDFRILEDGVEQEVLNVVEEKVPVKVALLIDVSGSTRYSQPSIKRAALRFAESLDEEDEIAVIIFSHAPKLILDWTNDLDKVEFALETVYAKGRTVMNDALYVTFDDLFRGVTGKKAVIMLTDGIDTGSYVSFDEALDLAVRSEAMVYVASKLDEAWAATAAARGPRTFGMGLPSDRDLVQVRRSLEKLAQMTGGRVLQAEAFSSLTQVYQSVAEELKNQYYVSYVSTNPSKDGTWRNVDLRVKRPRVTIRTRPGYYASVGG